MLGQDLKPHTALCWHLVLGVPGCQGAAARWVVLAPVGKLHRKTEIVTTEWGFFCKMKVKLVFSLSLNVVWLNLNHFVQPKRKGSAWCQGGHFSCPAISEESWLCSYISEARL